MCDHNKVEVSTGDLINAFDSPTMEVDKAMAPLIAELRARGILADPSCEELRPGLASITFVATIDVADFLVIAQKDCKVNLETWWDTDTEKPGLQAAVEISVLFPTKDNSMLARRLAETPKPERRDRGFPRRWGPRNN